ncbi:CocE/NonD family hydrolase [Pseudomonas sp. D4002]|uniref:CocE/NonD family hydrolase n=1 Tax=Pseudomonas sp. D4002 TaxID=2738817 RepID=UPI0015A2469A|nr:CocE/NonD family hydrolase [Pseudomonas sp. D4002]
MKVKRADILPGVSVPYIEMKSPLLPEARTPAFAPGTKRFPKGEQLVAKGLRLPCSIVLDQDVSVPMRDGIKLVANIYRPEGDVQQLPVVMSFTPYGKMGGYWHLGRFPFNGGIPLDSLSGLQSFEAPDPAYWCDHGYCVVYVCARGTDHSEGDHNFQGSSSANDAYDAIEWIAAQSWCNGSVGMAGNSQLAMIQWAAAAVRPPHLKAIAPWEGLSNHYHENICSGGIPFPSFHADVIDHSYGNGMIEDVCAALKERPFYDEYWADKAPDIENINIPAYVVASYTNQLHCKGTFAAYRKLDPALSWLRIHNTMEWPDFYTPAYVEDMRRFFDRYLKGNKNDWEKTARVRMAVLDLGGKDVVDRPEDTFPPKGATLRSFYLDGRARKLVNDPVACSSEVSYQSDDRKGKVEFEVKFTKDTEISGYPALRLWVHSDDADDMDIYVVVEKVRRRKPLFRSIMPPPFKPLVALIGFLHRKGIFKYGFSIFNGPNGRLRVSRRELDGVNSKENLPVYKFNSEQKLARGQVVPVDISILPTSMKWSAGDTLRLSVMGYERRGQWFPAVDFPESINVGKHVIHTGGEFNSVLTLPIVER